MISQASTHNAPDVITPEHPMAIDEANMDLDALLDLYIEEAHSELERGLEAAAADRQKLRAAFEAGTPLTAKVPVELYDPIDDRVIEVKAGAVMRVAEHQGDILIGRLSDNTHSLAVVYEPPGRWIPRKHFLPMATLVDRTRIEQGLPPQGKLKASGFKGAGIKGIDDGTEAAIQSIEALAARDAFAVLPRGTRILVDAGALTFEEGTPTPSGAIWVEVTAAVGDVRDKSDAEQMPLIPVRLPDGGPTGALPFEALQHLDFKEHVLTPAAFVIREAALRERRRFLRRVTGAGLAVAFLGLDGILWGSGGAQWPPDAPPAERVLSAVIPQMATVLAYFQAGGKYWFELDGPLHNLKTSGCLTATRRLSDALDVVASGSDRLWETWRDVYHRRVHVGWTEHKHYRTDKNGRRSYTHSTWSKRHRYMWVEPGALSGSWQQLEAWDAADDLRRERGHRLLNEPIFQLLECTPEQAESQFTMMRQDISFTRDATISAFSAALCTAPAAFFSDIVGAVAPGMRPALHPRKGHFTAQKPALLAMGAVAGALLSHTQQQQLNAELSQNKKALGALLEGQLGEVPTLTYEQAWRLFFEEPLPDALVKDVERRRAYTRELAEGARSFTYTYGDGWDNGRRLDAIEVDASPIKGLFPQLAPRWITAAEALQVAMADQAALLPVLRNVVGTERLNARIREDAAEATGGAWKQSLWLAAPVWGAAIIDMVLKGMGR